MLAVKIIGAVISICYPVIVFLSLAVFHFPIRVVALSIMALAAALFLFHQKKSSRATPLLMALVALLVLVTGSERILRFYPVLVNLVMLLTFLLSIHGQDSIVLTFAELADRRIKRHPARGSIGRYCRKVTMVWCIFFVMNGTIALITTLCPSQGLWVIYNGLVAYILIGGLFMGEFAVRQLVNGKIQKRVLLTELGDGARDDDRIIAYRGEYSDGVYTTWREYLEDAAKVRQFLSTRKEERVIIHLDDFYLFNVALTATMQSGKAIALSANSTPEFLSELMDGNTIGLFEKEDENIYDINRILENKEVKDLSLPSIHPESKIQFFTSGSTGTPKPIDHTIGELEEDNGYFGAMWRKDFQNRVVASSVNPHHIFGFMFATIKPFMEGVPFRRERIENPDEFRTLVKDRLLVVTSPAFLKAVSEDPELQDGVALNDPYIVSSGGPMTKETAAAIERILGFWPVEIYGSTETSGIAWKVTKDPKTTAWQPLDNVKLTNDSEGCLIIQCPAILGGAPFHTNDLVAFNEDGSFILKGRKDSVVKIAEKRISLVEVENRIMQTGLAKDAKAVVLKRETREYLGAALVLSDEGKRRTEGMGHGAMVKLFRGELAKYLESVAIPRRYRFVDAIPVNSMGKVQLEEVKALFDLEIEA